MLKRLLIIGSILVSQAVSAGPATLLVLGDSLSAAYGIETERGWVALLSQRLLNNGYNYQVVNASISGDTTRGGLSRLPSALDRHKPTIVIVELGGNDGLRGLSVDEARHNLSEIIRLCRLQKAKVLLVSVPLPPNYGPVYTNQFSALFRELAAKHRVGLAPSLLANVGGNDALMQADGIHPRAEAQTRLLDNIWPYLQPMLGQPRLPAKAG